MQIWKDIKDYEGLYQISNAGQVKCLTKTWHSGLRFVKSINERIKAIRNTDNGYLQTTLHKDGIATTFTIHKLVAIAFIENPNNLPEINHKDGDKKNNNDWNLEWCTKSHNAKHAYSLGLRVAPMHRVGKIGKQCGKSKAVIQMNLNGEEISQWDSMAIAANHISGNRRSISACVTGKQKSAYGFKWKLVS